MSEPHKFRQSALSSGLITDDQLRDAVAQTMQVKSEASRSTATEFTDKELAAMLVKLEYLTPYQSDQLLSGRTKLNLGPYIITDWIGQGGMGQVFKAVHEMLGRESAVKVLPLHKTTPEAIVNFRREIRAQAKLDHPNLVRAFDAGEDGNVHYLVVEFVPGTDLRRLVRTKGRLTVQQAANVIKHAAEGLAHAHERDLIHRDIKPGNILVTPDGVAKVSDLGLAFYLNDPEDPRFGKIVGTADYLSPEQIKTPLEVTEVSDIYSLGCTLYYAVTGKVPFPGGTPKSKARRHLQETPWHPRRFNEEVSDEFVDLIGDMMEKNPEERIQSAMEVAERLAPWASDDSLMLNDEIEPQRWTPESAPSADNQDTDPKIDVADMAITEMSGFSDTNHSTIQSQDTDRISGSQKPPVPGSITSQFSNAGRLQTEEVMFSLPTFAVGLLVAVAVGVLIGVIIGLILWK